MKLKIYQVDAFAENIFEGNPAAVIPLKRWLPDETLQKIALENNLSETAFFISLETGFQIRWFTPLAEVKLCGHATLASAHVLFQHLNYNESEIRFQSRSGILKVKKENDLIVLDFPASKISEIEIPEDLISAFNIQPKKCIKGRDDFMLIFENESTVSQLKPDFQQLVEAKTRGVICTSKSEKYDFVSRFFAPAVGVNEDPVTGSAHTMLIPYWSKELDKKEMIAKQISARGGVLHCKNLDERVEIGGKAVTYLIGEIIV
ncbi:MAG TPA: PhzF family phenazine biosynthesis protein [Draconibacterium sp.]|nr:PhzF family phenazine biosynthesis protein [Draconibacterium sp.]HRX11606.1 PhzF family phenazine biosynthesis protein [Draconibacterium sp.]